MAPLLIPVAMELAKFAPSIIKVLTGSDKAADVAGHVVKIAQTVTDTATPEEALEVIKADPNKIIEFQQAIAAEQVDMEKAYLANIANARAMQIAALAQEDLFSKRFVYYFAAAWSLFSMLYFTAVTFIPLTPAGQRIADTILGVMIASVIGVMFAYFYGSTRGSLEKSKLLAMAEPAK